VSPYLRLARLPNVFTSLADVLAGLLIARAGHLQPRDAALVAASGLLYPAGMVLNDFFDRELDARERPERPIPSGEVSARAAGRLGFTLLAGGVALASLAGLASAATAAALAAAIVLYDALTKSTVVGPVIMGLCRLLNVALGLSVAADVHTLRTLPMAGVALPVGLGIYTCLLTLLARDEVHGGARGRVRLVLAAMGALGLAYIVLLASGSAAGLTPPALVFDAYLAVRGVTNFARTWANPLAATVGRSIGGGILLMPVIDAAAVAASGQPLAAALVFAAIVPAQLLRRWFAMS
jgi:4-hydroxybenzoate polyprenyltransferase